METVYDSAGDRPLLMPNDLVFDDTGGFWFTDFGRREADMLRYGALCYGHADGRAATRPVPDLLTPNGTALSPDGKRVYVSETATGNLWGLDLVGPGDLIPRDPQDPGACLMRGFGGHNRYDSMAAEANGNICIGSLLPGQIVVVAQDGTLVDRVPMPDALPTNICFGGPDMKTAWITLSQSGQILKMDWPRAGLALAY